MHLLSRLKFAGNENVELTVGEGPDHGRFDVYIGGSLWETIDGYAASDGERVIPIPLSNDGPFTLQVNNRADKGSASSGHVMRFKQLSVDAEYTLQTIGYTYDAASRVLDADTYPGENTASTPVETFAYEYDVAGNLTDNNGTARTFNKLNQISSGGVTYDANGNMTSDGTNAYTWDRANRLRSMGGHEYAYDGMGNRVSQTVSSIVTRYLLDVQPGLVQVLRATTGGFSLDPVQSYVHGPRGVHAEIGGLEIAWTHLLQDGLGSVRSEVSPTLNVNVSGAYEPYGVPSDVEGAYTQPFRFTGEMRDEIGLQYHRSRYFSAVHPTWLSMDLLEGRAETPTSLNAYSWVDGNTINWNDPSGLVPIDIWIAAFISPPSINFPFAGWLRDAATGRDYFFNDIAAAWHGDGRSWYTGGPIPSSSRVWIQVHFDTRDPGTSSWWRTDTGISEVTARAVNGQVLTVQGKQAPPDMNAVKFAYWRDHVEIHVKVASSNPLMLSPTIDFEYDIHVNRCRSEILVWARNDAYPWHELFMQVEGVGILTINDPPGGPFYSPADLFSPQVIPTHYHVTLPRLSWECNIPQIAGFPSTMIGLHCIPNLDVLVK